MPDYFNKEASNSYDEKNKNLAAIADNMHFLIRLILKELPSRANILCVGVGTGAEIMSLAKENPEWTFTGVDPSSAMLDVCRERLKVAGFLDRCRLIHGYVQETPHIEDFDAALSVLVGHFVPRAERLSFYQNMQQRLKGGGYLINTEISYDLASPAFSSMVKNWERVQKLMGATPESLDNLPTVLKTMLSVLPPEETESLLRASGIPTPVRFFQSFMIHGWYGQKPT